MKRRAFLGATAFLAAGAEPDRAEHVEIPVLRIVDRNAHANASGFISTIWKEAGQVFGRGGITLRVADGPGEVLQYPSGRPRFRCVDRSRINVVLTDRVPLDWDKGRSLAGVSALYEGFCICVISMNEAHGNQIPFLAVNTVVHELLHVLLEDVFRDRTSAFHGQSAEARVDLHATRLWLFGGDETVRESAKVCLERLAKGARETRSADSCAST
jgi:hypothetical protein